MKFRPVTLALALSFSISLCLPGCDSTANLTEQEHIQRAKDFEDKGNLKGSIVELKNAIQKNPDSPQARLLLGKTYVKAGLGAEAEKELVRAKQLGVSPDSMLTDLGEALLLMGEYKRVLDEIIPGNQTSKTNHAKILQIRADALLNQRKHKEACDLYQQSLEKDNSNPPTYWGLAQCAVAEKNLPKAKEWLEIALKINNRKAVTWVYMGELELKKGNKRDAIAAYANALQVDPVNYLALERKIAVSLSDGQLETARHEIDQLLKLVPNSVQANYLLALLNYQQKKHSETLDILQKVFRINPKHAPSIFLAGANSYALGSFEQAETYLNQTLVNSPENASARKLLASVHLKQKQPDKAIETLSPILAKYPNDAQALSLAGESNLNKGEFTQATDLFSRAATAAPNDAAIQTKLGLSRLAAGNTKLGISELEAAAAMDNSQHQANALLILTHLSQKEYDKALTAIMAMEKKVPNSPFTHNMKGLAFLGKNDLGNGRKSFEKALSIDPTFFPAAANLAELDLKDKNLAAAEKRFSTILEKDKNNVQAMYALANLAAIKKQESSYLDWMEKAMKANPKDMKPVTTLVRFHVAKKEYRKALSLANDAVNDNPDRLEALSLLGGAQMAAGDNQGAVVTFSRLAQKAPNSPDALLKLASAQIADRQTDSARKSLLSAIKLNPAFLEAQEALVRLELQDKKPDAAIKIARQLQTRFPKNHVGFDLEAGILMALKQYAQAAKAYDQSLAAGAGSMSVIRLHNALSLAGDAKSADQRLSKWLSQHPSDMAVRSYAAENMVAFGRSDEAIRLYEELLKANPNDLIALNNLANLYSNRKDMRAVPMAERALTLAPENAGVLDTLGWILVEQGQLPRGLNLLQQAAAKTPDAASIRYHYAVALARSGKRTEAKKELSSLINTNKPFPELDQAKALFRTL
jgi:putative PEP-CTERM system TPR-repeat lipoprotein